MIRSQLRTLTRSVVGPEWFDALVHFRRIPLVNDIVADASGTRCVFIEPHFDDVAFSCGGILTALARRSAPPDLITIFSADPESERPLSPLAKQIHEEWGSDGASYQIRRREARRIDALVDINRIEVGLAELIYRDASLTRLDELTGSQSVPSDDPVNERVSRHLESILCDHEPTTLFAPLGVGRHRDHLIVHRAVRTLKARQDVTVWYYEEVPYALDYAALKDRVRRVDGYARPATVDITETLDARIRLSNCYSSQVEAIFGTPTRMRQEIEHYAERVGSPLRPRERFWQLSESGRSRHFGRRR